MICSITHIISFFYHMRYAASVRVQYVVLLLTVFFTLPALARQKEPEYTETSIFLTVEGIGGTEVSAIVYHETGYLSITEVFNYLRIRNQLSKNSDVVSGSFISEQAIFSIDKTHNQILFKGKIIELQQQDLIATATDLFMKTELFGSMFGLDCKFSFRSLSVNMRTKLELPAIREMREETMHRNISRLKGQLKADTVIRRSYPLFQFGMADWSVIASQRSKGVSDTRLGLSLGAILAGGEANVSLNYNNYAQQQRAITHDSSNNIKPFDRRQQYYRWRYVNNDHRGLRQITAGKIFVQSTASIYDPVVGVQITNTPSTYRRSFGSYTLSNFTEPGWAVELYVNNELVDYKKADASGFFSFEVPLVYGNSLVKLRFYGPWGEERFREENISIPFNFLPHREFEYTASAGVVEDSTNSRFGRISLNYGATRRLTVGGGVEYLSSVASGKSMPFINASMRLGAKLLLAGDYTYGVRARGIMTYRLPSNLQFEMNYSRYKKGQKAINYNYLEERKLIISKSFTGRNMAVFSRVTLNQIILPETKYTTAEWLISGALLGVGANLTTYAILTEQADPYVYSNLSLSFRLPDQILITPQVQYEYNNSKVIAARCELGKYLFRYAYMNISYEKNFKSNFTNVGVGVRFDFSFSQIGLSAWRTNEENLLIQSARGGLIFDGGTGSVSMNNRVSVGTGGIAILAFLDLNGNDRRDKGEPKLEGLQIAVNGGRIFHNKRDTSIRILELEPYSNYIIDTKGSSFENIAWRIKRPTISVMIDPNRVKLVEVPVVVAGEVSGSVYLEGKGLGRIVLGIYREDNTLVARVLTETDGFFSFMDLAPGNYTAKIDTAQLLTLGMTASPSAIPFHISGNREGDVVDTLEFQLQKSK
ncbi:hypothetical protein GFS24_23685 [Chitinophaga sp. SYP-B3965]|uniref:hypothetical protein n=1 Tax=Chitinophaga sp. SYP-B3965 TaxID=2663120 RepID=UPI001299EA6C|nr:hypothetical protein [Chitinophaga sp. SYP-B3965]MRG48142.1 hypothetical protein [Chitinophaga sp. SYP-B3965]